MATACPGDLAGRRDRALLLLMAAGLGRLALVGLDVERLRFAPEAVELTLAGDPVCQVTVARGANPSACPVQALRDWLRASDTRFGPERGRSRRDSAGSRLRRVPCAVTGRPIAVSDRRDHI
jgi:site-specific recombinase XerC